MLSQVNNSGLVSRPAIPANAPVLTPVESSPLFSAADLASDAPSPACNSIGGLGDPAPRYEASGAPSIALHARPTSLGNQRQGRLRSTSCVADSGDS